MDKLTSEIRKKGLSMPQFCASVLGVEYKSFRARIREQRLRLSEIKLIIIYTNMTFEQLFMDAPLTNANSEELAEPTPPPVQEAKPNNSGYIESY